MLSDSISYGIGDDKVSLLGSGAVVRTALLEDVRPCGMYEAGGKLVVFDAISNTVARYGLDNGLVMEKAVELGRYGDVTPSCGDMGGSGGGWLITADGTAVLLGEDLEVVRVLDAPDPDLSLFVNGGTLWAVKRNGGGLWSVTDSGFIAREYRAPALPVPNDTLLSVAGDPQGRLFSMESKILYRFNGKGFDFLDIHNRMEGRAYGIFETGGGRFIQGGTQCHIVGRGGRLVSFGFPGATAVSQSCVLGNFLCVRSYPNEYVGLYAIRNPLLFKLVTGGEA